MKITEIATYMVDFGVSNYIFVKVFTDEGIEGVGEATLEGKELSVLGAIEEMKRLFVGEDPRNIELLWRKWHMTSCWKGVTDFTAISGIEQALWDITGKYYNAPLYRLWGGPVREAIRAYTWPGPYTTPQECGEAAAHAVEKLGFTGLKFDLITESVHTRTLSGSLVKNPLEIHNGYIPLPTRPGLGIELDEAVIAKHPGDPKDIWFPKRLVY